MIVVVIDSQEQGDTRNDKVDKVETVNIVSLKSNKRHIAKKRILLLSYLSISSPVFNKGDVYENH